MLKFPNKQRATTNGKTSQNVKRITKLTFLENENDTTAIIELRRMVTAASVPMKSYDHVGNEEGFHAMKVKLNR